MKCKLQEIVDVTMGQSPKSEYYNTDGKGYPFLQGNRTFGFKYPSFDTYTTVMTKPAKAGDVIMSVRAPVGDLNITPVDMCLGRGVCSLRMKNGNQSFLYYMMKYYVPHLLKKESGTVFGSVNRNDINGLEVDIPEDEQIQRRIARYLEMIDEKIELNNAINNNLAEQSQAIFTEFMDCYPYKLTPLGDMAEIIDCLHSKKPEAVSDTTLQLLQLNNITDSGFLDLSLKYYISKSDYDNWTRKCEIVEGDCVITNVGRIGAVSQAPVGTHAAMGRNMTCIRLKKDKPFHSYLITALLSNHIRKEIMKNTDEGTIMGALNVKNIPLLLFPVFETSVMVQLENILSPIRKTIEQNYLSNQTLTQTRDTLLPKLMSGELDFSDIDL